EVPQPDSCTAANTRLRAMLERLKDTTGFNGVAGVRFEDGPNDYHLTSSALRRDACLVLIFFPPLQPPIGLEAAKKVMAAAEGESVKNNWGMAIAILDSTGHIVMLHKLDNTQYGSIAVAEDKARSALYYRRPSKVFEDWWRRAAWVCVR